MPIIESVNPGVARNVIRCRALWCGRGRLPAGEGEMPVTVRGGLLDVHC